MIYNIIDTYVSCCDIQNILYANKYIILYNIILYYIISYYTNEYEYEWYGDGDDNP